MPNYVRSFVPGGTFFFTVALLDRRLDLLTANVSCLRTAFRDPRRRRPFTIEAIVVLPDHLHCIWTLPLGDADFPARWHDIKSRFAARISLGERLTPRRVRKGERGIWQRRYWEHQVRDEGDFARHADYIHFNPIKHGWARQVEDWPYSSFRRFVQQGIYEPDWGGTTDAYDLDLE